MVNTTLVWLPTAAAEWQAISPVPVTGVATDGVVVYAQTSNGVLCGEPLRLTLCPTTVAALSPTLSLTAELRPPGALVDTMGGRVVLGADGGLLRGAVWVVPNSGTRAQTVIKIPYVHL